MEPLADRLRKMVASGSPEALVEEIVVTIEARASGRLVDREAIDRERIEDILNELCRDWGESLKGAVYDFGRAIDAIAEAIDV